MATKTALQIRNLASQKLGDFVTGTATGGGAGGATITTTDLLREPGASYAQRYAEITEADGAAPENEVRLVNTSTVSSGTLTLTPYNAYSAIVQSGDSFAIHFFDPAWKLEAINEVLRELRGVIPVEVIEYMPAGECLKNRSFEWWRDSSTPYDWAAVAGTVAKNTDSAYLYEGTANLKLTGTGSVGSMKQQVKLEKHLEGVRLTLKAYIYGTANAGVYLSLSQGSTTITASKSGTTVTKTAGKAFTASDVGMTIVWGAPASTTDTITAYTSATVVEVSASATIASQSATVGRSPVLATSNAWTLLTATMDISDRYQPIFAHVVNTSNAAVYFDACRLYVPITNGVFWLPYSDYYEQLSMVEVGPRSDVTGTLTEEFAYYRMPESYRDGFAWYRATWGRDYTYGLESSYPQLINQGIGGTLPNPYWMRLTGEGRFPTVTALADTIELTEEQAQYVAVKAAIKTLQRAQGYMHLADPDYIRGLIVLLQPQEAVLAQQVRKQGQPIHSAGWRWGGVV